MEAAPPGDILQSSASFTGERAMSIPSHLSIAASSCEETIPSPEGVWGDDERIAMIAENAYYRAQGRGFLPGYEFEDWLAAEREIDALMARDR
jgi:hypothetical protein